MGSIREDESLVESDWLWFISFPSHRLCFSVLLLCLCRNSSVLFSVCGEAGQQAEDGRQGGRERAGGKCAHTFLRGRNLQDCQAGELECGGEGELSQTNLTPNISRQVQ